MRLRPPPDLIPTPGVRLPIDVPAAISSVKAAEPQFQFLPNPYILGIDIGKFAGEPPVLVAIDYRRHHWRLRRA